jgi:hypothetical protein
MRLPLPRSLPLVAFVFLIGGPLLVTLSLAISTTLLSLLAGQMPSQVSVAAVLLEGPLLSLVLWLLFSITWIGMVLMWGPTLLAAFMYWACTTALHRRFAFISLTRVQSVLAHSLVALVVSLVSLAMVIAVAFQELSATFTVASYEMFATVAVDGALLGAILGWLASGSRSA